MSRKSSDTEDLHEALIDLYLSVKIRSNDEVSIKRQLNHTDWYLQWEHALKGKEEAYRNWQFHDIRLHQDFHWNSNEHEDGREWWRRWCKEVRTLCHERFWQPQINGRTTQRLWGDAVEVRSRGQEPYQSKSDWDNEGRLNNNWSSISNVCKINLTIAKRLKTKSRNKLEE